ncbi:MAG: hypothetical protein MUF04_01115 [Akkermansiaceae bacterium]|jgi:uncharacterized protein (TIGR03382 family)|nr:hypothetical protein [Akkermansiaceae bacterium]
MVSLRPPPTNLGNDKQAYFQQGNLQVVVVPKPAAAPLGSLGLLALLRRRRQLASNHE